MLDLIATSPPCADHMGLALTGLADLVRAAGYRFQTVTPATHQRVLQRGQRWARDLADAFGWNLPFHTALLDEARCAELAAAGVIEAHGEGWKARLRAATLGQRIVFHSAYPTEQEDAVFFGPDTYRFVAAIERTLPALPLPARVIDIGCGAGAAAIVLAGALPHAEVIGADINQRALALTAHNARIAGVRLQTAHSDLLDGVDGRFDLIVANPPYMLDASARAYRHGGGGHGEGLALAIVRAGLARLAPGGSLLLYTGAAIVRQRDQFYEAAAPLLRAAGCAWHYEELDPDVFGEQLEQPGYADVERIAAVWLTVTMSASASA
ncbi:MAG: SAM-dependent methyltransferase [Massilia sp.]|nr:SAM-dependent methyltransferase [Massilia sp.]